MISEPQADSRETTGRTSLFDARSKLAEIEQMCCASSDSFDAGQWCEAAGVTLEIARSYEDAIRAFIGRTEAKGYGHKMHRSESRGGGLYRWECDDDCPLCALQEIARAEL